MTAVLALVIGLLGADPAALAAWGRTPGDRVALADALARAALPRLSTAVLTEVLVIERAQPAQVSRALDRYPLSLRGEPPIDRVLAALAEAPTAGLNESRIALRGFLVGQALLVTGEPTAALRQLGRVPPGSPAYAPARYLMGVARITPPLSDLKAAATHFREAIIEAESSAQAPRRVVGQARRLALLGLARLSFEVGNNEVALYYDRQLPRRAPERVEANFEAAWAHLLRGDLPRALGAVHGARSPDEPHPDQAELHLVAGAALMGLCQYERGRWELDALQSRYLAHLEAVEQAALAVSEGANPRKLLGAAGGLPEAVRDALRADPRVASALADEAALTDELSRVEAIATDRGVDLSLVTARGVTLLAREGARVTAAVGHTVTDMATNWRRLSDARDELLVDLLEAEGSALETAIEGRREGAAEAAGDAQQAIALGEDWQRWEVDATWWPDELGDYRSTLPARCGEARP